LIEHNFQIILNGFYVTAELVTLGFDFVHNFFLCIIHMCLALIFVL